jgi:hypothetical protein
VGVGSGDRANGGRTGNGGTSQSTSTVIRIGEAAGACLGPGGEAPTKATRSASPQADVLTRLPLRMRGVEPPGLGRRPLQPASLRTSDGWPDPWFFRLKTLPIKFRSSGRPRIAKIVGGISLGFSMGVSPRNERKLGVPVLSGGAKTPTRSLPHASGGEGNRKARHSLASDSLPPRGGGLGWGVMTWPHQNS